MPDIVKFFSPKWGIVEFNNVIIDVRGGIEEYFIFDEKIFIRVEWNPNLRNTMVGQLCCFDFQGNLVWSLRDLPRLGGDEDPLREMAFDGENFILFGGSGMRYRLGHASGSIKSIGATR